MRKYEMMMCDIRLMLCDVLLLRLVMLMLIMINVMLIKIRSIVKMWKSMCLIIDFIRNWVFLKI